MPTSAPLTHASASLGVAGAPASAQPRFARSAWGVLVYTLFVILFGAWVRITGSGAGCGDHWPSCHGEIVPRAPETATLIEYTHRVTSGALGPMVLGLLLWAWFGAGRRRAVRVCAALTVVFVGVEAAIGAGLVKGGLVAENSSMARALVVALHLGNTLLLTAVAGLTAWLGAGRSLRVSPSGIGKQLGVLLGCVVVVSMTGAVTALGDTLFPVPPAEDGGMFARVRDGLDAGSHFLVRLRVVHPLLAIALAVSLAWIAGGFATRAAPGSEVRKLARGVEAFSWAQLACGAINVMSSAPGWLQLVHLLLAQGLWIVLVLLFVTSAELPAEPARAE